MRRRLRDHLGGDPADLPIVSRDLAAWDRPNFQVAIDAWSAGRDVEVAGLPVIQGYRAGLAELVRTAAVGANARARCRRAHDRAARRAREHHLRPVRSLARARRRGAARGDADEHRPRHGREPGLEVMVADRERGERVLAELWKLMRELNVYRGRVLELGSRYFHDDEGAPLTVRTLPKISRDRIVLPPGVLERIERQAFGIADHAERLRASGRHLRRGLLLYGPPGTGKTLTAMYLAAQMPGRTAVLLTGESLGAVGAVDRPGDRAAAGDGRARGRRSRRHGPVRVSDEPDPVRAAQRDGRPRRGSRRPLRADHQPRGPARARARRPPRADRPGGRASAPGRRRAPAAARALRRGAGAHPHRRRAADRDARGRQPRLHPRAAAARGAAGRRASRRARSPSARATWSARSRSSGTAPAT